MEFIEEDDDNSSNTLSLWSNEPYLFSSALQEAINDESNWLKSSFLNIHRDENEKTVELISIIQKYDNKEVMSLFFPFTSENMEMVDLWKKFYKHSRSQRDIMGQFAKIDIDFLNENDRADEASKAIDRFTGAFLKTLGPERCSIFLAKELVKFSWSMRTYVGKFNDSFIVFEKMFAPCPQHKVNIFAPFDLESKYLFYSIEQWIPSKDVVTLVLNY